MELWSVELTENTRLQRGSEPPAGMLGMVQAA
jgi:hypothetical protein